MQHECSQVILAAERLRLDCDLESYKGLKSPEDGKKWRKIEEIFFTILKRLSLV